MGLLPYLLIVLISIINLIEVDRAEEYLFPNNENLDIFEYAKELEDNNLLIYNITYFALINLIGKEAINEIVNKEKLYNFLLILAKEYNSNNYPKINPYHNIYHASHVVQNLYIYLLKSENKIPLLFEDTYVKEKDELEQSNINYKNLDIFALIIAAACHDFRHPGKKKKFYLDYKDKVPFAKILEEYEYNLEPYHYAEAKKLIEETQLLELLNNYQKERFYKIMKLVIYGTAGSYTEKHSKDILTYKDIINMKNIELIKGKIKKDINFKINNIMKKYYINQAIDDIKLTIFNCFLFMADNSITTIKDRYYFIEWSDKIADESCLQNIEIHSIDSSKEINCIGNDDEKFRLSLKKFFESIGDIYFISFCEVFNNLKYLCQNYENNKKFIESKEKIHI